MTIVTGKIEPLKKLKEILNDNGISRFNSIGEINTFIKNYESEKKEIPDVITNSLDEEINKLQTALLKRQKILDDLKIETQNQINKEIASLKEISKQTIEKSNRNIFNKIFYYLKIKKLTNKKLSLEKNLENTIRKRTRFEENDLPRLKINWMNTEKTR